MGLETRNVTVEVSQVATPRPSFEEYSKENAVKKPCWFCGLPEREEIETAIASGTGTKAGALRYLRDVCGYTEVTQNRVDHHFSNHVPRPA